MIFIDFERAFDSLKHTAIWQTLTEWEVPTKVVNIIRNYIINQHVKSSIETGKAKSIPMRNGVKQGCALSPLLFNIVLDTALSKANDTQRGIRWTLTDRLEDLDYADDICLLAYIFNDIRTKLQ